MEAVAHELRNPGWFAQWLARKSAPASVAPAGARVKTPMSPWMAFVHVSTAFLRSLHPSTCTEQRINPVLDKSASHCLSVHREC